MSDERVKALREIATAILDATAEPDAATPAAEQASEPTLGRAYAAEQAAAAERAEAQRGPAPPAGKSRLANLTEWEALPQAERIARMDEADALILRDGLS